MLFNTLQFAIFFSAVLLAHRSLPPRARPSMLLLASSFFYALWHPAYLLLLLGEIGVNYLLLRRIERSRKSWMYLAASIIFTLGMLAYFKYAALILETVLPLLRPTLGLDPPIPDIFLPLGISFFSFQIVALAVDTARRDGPAVASLSQYALYVSFFPQLIAGPILRGHELLPQLPGGGRIEPERTRRGIWLLASGVFKKSVMADFLLAPFADGVFGAPGLASAPFHLLAMYSFAFQIYFDFSGYTDMARGLACLLGFELPLNFREPYLSRDPAEFWRRWHITLSQWLRDYLYIPIGGNRGGSARMYVNLFLTMLLGGLWHGAAWTFVIWGGLHGLLLVVHRLTGGRQDPERAVVWRDLPRIVLLFHAVCVMWIFFRATDFESAMIFIGSLAGLGEAGGWPVMQCLVVAFCVVLHPLERALRTRLPDLRAYLEERAWGGLVLGAALGAILALVWVTGGAGGEFIYFQF